MSPSTQIRSVNITVHCSQLVCKNSNVITLFSFHLEVFNNQIQDIMTAPVIPSSQQLNVCCFVKAVTDELEVDTNEP